MTEDQQTEFRLVELARRLANVVRPGIVGEVDPARGAVRVKFGKQLEALTTWLPFMAARAGGDASWAAPEVGEQVILLAPSGELVNAVVLGSLYSNMNPAPSDDPDKSLTRYSDGTEAEYDRTAHKVTADVDAKILGDVEIVGNVIVTGNVTAGGDVEDGLGKMAEMRTAHNRHTHGVPPGPAVPAPNERMG